MDAHQAKQDDLVLLPCKVCSASKEAGPGNPLKKLVLQPVTRTHHTDIVVSSDEVMFHRRSVVTGDRVRFPAVHVMGEDSTRDPAAYWHGHLYRKDGLSWFIEYEDLVTNNSKFVLVHEDEITYDPPT